MTALMTKGCRAGDSQRSRLFKISNQSDLAELRDLGFDNERRMQDLIERNIGTLFPGLKLLKTEFEIVSGELRLDTVAFDTTLDTFVALEYKNRPDKAAIDQARTYMRSMKLHQEKLVLLHIERMKGMSRNKKPFKWNSMYAIVIAPGFSKYQIRGTDKDPNLELYETCMYDDHIMLVKRVGGGHEQPLATASTPGPSAKMPQDQAAVHAPSFGANKPQMKQLYDTIRARLLDEFPGSEENKTKFYDGFRYPGGKQFCTIALQKSKIWLAYSGKRAASKLKPDGFVKGGKGWGVGKYHSEIRNGDDFKKALSILRWLHAGRPGKSDRSNVGTFTTNTPGVFNPRYG